MPKRCVLFVIDAFAEQITREWMDAGRLPSLAKVLEQGGVLSPCLSIFPSITPAATCSIATGAYPKKTGIEGACWFDPETNDLAYYGDDFKLIFEQGFTRYLTDFGDRLNFERLSEPTIYERLESAGVPSACINYMWFRGDHEHSRVTPLTLRALAEKLDPTLHGPRYLKLGDFVHSLPEEVGEVPGMQSGPTGRFGFHDETTLACMLAMGRADALPPFTLAYFPLHDDDAHKYGLREAASRRLERFDQFLARFVESIGGWDRVGTDVSMMMVGDHGQSIFDDGGPRAVPLDGLLEGFHVGDTGQGFQSDDEVLVCPNMRAAAIYTAKRSPELHDRLVERLLEHEAVDQAIYESETSDGTPVRCVAKKGCGRFEFAPAESSPPGFDRSVTDDYGNRWSCAGDLAALDLDVDSEGHLREGRYLNPLERIHGAQLTDGRPLWVTAQPQVEFMVEETSPHHAGSHGSLDIADSTAGLVTTADIDLQSLTNPHRPRIVDVLDLCLVTLGVRGRDLVSSPKSVAHRG